MKNCAFRPQKLHLEYLDADKMRYLVEKSIWNFWRQIKWEANSRILFQWALTYSDCHKLLIFVIISFAPKNVVREGIILTNIMSDFGSHLFWTWTHQCWSSWWSPSTKSEKMHNHKNNTTTPAINILLLLSYTTIFCAQMTLLTPLRLTFWFYISGT